MGDGGEVAATFGGAVAETALLAELFSQLWLPQGCEVGLALGRGVRCGLWPFVLVVVMLLLVRATVRRPANASECLGEAALVLDAMLAYYPPPACPWTSRDVLLHPTPSHRIACPSAAVQCTPPMSSSGSLFWLLMTPHIGCVGTT